MKTYRAVFQQTVLPQRVVLKFGVTVQQLPHGRKIGNDTLSSRDGKTMDLVDHLTVRALAFWCFDFDIGAKWEVRAFDESEIDANG
jgi:hypothetical protein